MSDEPRSSYAHVPILSKTNYQNWALKVKAYLAPNRHVRVLRRTVVEGVETDPSPPDPDDVDEFDSWMKSEQVALGIMIATATDLHFEICHTYECGPAWGLWRAIEECHVVEDASLRYDAWMDLFAVRKAVGESYCNMFRRIEAARSKIVRVTPADLSSKEQFDEITLFSALNALPHDDLLRRQLTAQSNITLRQAYLTFLHTDRDATLVTAKSANATSIVLCYRCEEQGHLAKDCLYGEQFKQLVMRIKSGTNRWGHGHGRGRGLPTGSQSNTTAAAAAPSQDSAGVSTSFPLGSDSAN